MGPIQIFISNFTWLLSSINNAVINYSKDVLAEFPHL